MRSLAILAMVTIAAATGASAFLLMRIASRDDAAAYAGRLYEQTSTILQAAIDPRFQTKAEEINRVFDRLVVIEAIVGGALFDDTGHLQQTFGEVPGTSFETIRRSSGAVFSVEAPKRIEFYYSPEMTNTPFHMLVRIDTGTMTALEALGASRQVLIASGSAAAAALVAGLLTLLLVVRPVRRLASAIDRIIADPANADGGDQLGGAAEIGMLAAALERFRGMLADVWRSKVSVADAILERSPFAIVQMTSEGTPTFANPAAVDLFDREIGRGQNSGALVVRDLATSTQSALRDHLAHFRGGTRPVEIVGRRTPRFAVAGSITVGVDTRAPTIISMFSDITAVHGTRLEAEARFASGTALLLSARRRELELKLSLESCITLMNGPDRGTDQHIDALPYAVEWLAGAKEAGMVVDAQVVNAEGPTVEGPADDLRAAMRLGLFVCYARCGSAPADMVIDAKGISFDTAGVTIRAQPSASAKVLHEAVAVDWQLAFAALRTAIRRANGQLAEFNSGETGVVLKFLLRGASERMSTMKAR